MQPNTITYPSNIEKFDINGDHSVYHFSDHTDARPHKLEMHRYNPKVVGTRLGRRRALIKITKTVESVNTLGETVYEPCVVRLETSVPVGTTNVYDTNSSVIHLVDLIAGEASAAVIASFGPPDLGTEFSNLINRGEI